MINYDQLRISEDGQSLFIDAHVHKSKYFDDVYIKRITICTEAQVRACNPQSVGPKYIYQKTFSGGTSCSLHQVYDNTQVLSGHHLMSMMQENGGWKLVFPQDSHSEENFLSVTFSGKYSILDGDYDPLLVVTTKSFDPMEEGLDSDKVLFTIKGRSHIGNGHAVWIFKGKGSVCNQHDLRIYLYRQNTVEEYEYVRLNDTDDVNFLHFYWQPYYLFHTEERKELHMVLNSNSFNESFIGQSLSNNLFFVYIECDGCPAPDTPCRLCSMTTLGVTFDEALLYQRVMQYTKELTQECHIPGGFTDFILLWNAFKASIETEHYIPAIKYYNMLFGKDSTDKLYGPQGVSTRVSYKGCGCNG